MEFNMKDINFLKQHNVDIDNSLELFGDIDTYNETIKEFKIGLNSKLEQIAKNYQENDLANYAIFVHSLKSDCKYFGFLKLANIAYAHEMNSKSNNAKWVKEHYEELITEANHVREIVCDYLEESEAPDSDSLTKGNIILVADDSEVVRAFVKKIFNDVYEIASAKNGEETIKIIQKHSNDDLIKAILLDLNMPKLDGFAVLDYLTEHNLLKKMPVTIISGDSSKEAIDKAFTYDIVDMLSKPFSESKIKATVEKTINFYNEER